MRVNCLDEATLQSYMDGELSPELSAQAATHIAACEACAESLSEAVSENAFFAAAFAPDPSQAVPTERLRASLDAAIAERNAPQRAPRGRTLWSFGALASWLSTTFDFAPRQAAAFASLLAVVAFAAIFGIVYLRPGEPNNVATVKKDESAAPPVATTSAPPAIEETTGGKVEVEVTPVFAPGTPESGVKRVKNTNTNRNERAPKTPQVLEESPAPLVASVPGEEVYLRAIASLSKVIELSGDAVLRPSYRAEYERNLAVIDRAIEDTRKVAATNPKDAETTAFLFSAYQKKIDLLSTVADHAQVATLKD